MDDITIRRAENCDTGAVEELLRQVHRVHSDIRPDIFRRGSVKYTEDELPEIFADDTRPVFVAILDGKVVGYAFCIFKQLIGDTCMNDIKTLYIDDLCVDEGIRSHGIGTKLYDHVKSFARENDCYNVTLNVWYGNTSAMKFYEGLGMERQRMYMEEIL